MKQLKIISAFYYDPRNPALGADVTKKVKSLVKNNRLAIDFKYNDAFPDIAYGFIKELHLEVAFDNTRFIKTYKENDKIFLPDDLEATNGNRLDKRPDLILILRDHWKMIVSIISLFTAGSLITNSFNFEKTNFFAGNSVKDNNVVQSNTTGDNVVGNKITIIQGNSSSTKFRTGPNELHESVFSLLDRMVSFQGTSVQRDDIFERSVGLLVSDDGYVKDVASYNTVYLSRIKDGPTEIACQFDSTWTKSISTMAKGSKIGFSGVISNNSALALETIVLEKCTFQ